MVGSSVLAKLDIRLLAVLSLPLVVTQLMGCNGKPSAPSAASVMQRLETDRPVSRVANNPPISPDCLLLNASILETTLQPNPEHRVLLSWRASVSDKKHPDALGYCIYRREARKNSKEKLITVHPFRQTTCTDDLVENGKKYIYVVRAIGANSKISDPSNVAHAEIPLRKPSRRPEGWPPSCRVAGDK